jgi:hypothetical protein
MYAGNPFSIAVSVADNPEGTGTGVTGVGVVVVVDVVVDGAVAEDEEPHAAITKMARTTAQPSDRRLIFQI